MKPRDGLRLHEDEHVGKGLEALTVAETGRQQPTTGTEPASGGFSEEPESFVGFHNWLFGDPKAYDRAWTVDLVQLRAFVAATQPRCWRLDLDTDSPARQRFLAGLVPAERRQARPARHQPVLWAAAGC